MCFYKTIKQKEQRNCSHFPNQIIWRLLEQGYWICHITWNKQITNFKLTCLELLIVSIFLELDGAVSLALSRHCRSYSATVTARKLILQQENWLATNNIYKSVCTFPVNCKIGLCCDLLSCCFRPSLCALQWCTRFYFGPAVLCYCILY